MKILHFIYGLSIGGAETFLINTIANIDADKFQFEIAIQNPVINNPTLENLIKDRNIKIHLIPAFPRHIMGQFVALKKLLKCNHFDAVHIHMNAAINPVPLLLSRFGRINKHTRFIVHSHNSNNNIGGSIGKLIHELNSRFLIERNAKRIACSDLAGKWMFHHQPYTVINNAIDVKHFQFNTIGRKFVRKDFGIPKDAIVIGNVGRFVGAKNHRRMLEIFFRYYKRNPNAYLLLVGDGELLPEIKDLANSFNINKNVIFTGSRTDIPQMLSAMDIFIFPSIFEGLGFVAIEAEASGLRIVASDTIPDVINLGGYVTFLPNSADTSLWCDELSKSIELVRNSDRVQNPVINSDFDISRMIRHMQNIYASCIR